jgi:hypothetical protein
MRTFILTLVALLAVGSARAQPAAQPAAPPAGAQKSGADPTDFITRYEPSFEHKAIDGGTSIDLLTLRADFALSPSASIRLDLPLVGYQPGADLAAVGFQRGFSLGDTVLQINLKPYASRMLAAIYGVRLDLATASLPEVGQGGNTYTPLGAVAFFLPHQTLFAPFVQWYLGKNLDQLPLEGTSDVNRLSLRPILLWQPGKKQIAYLLVDPELIWNFESDRFTSTLSVEYGTAIGRAELLILKPTFALTSGTTNWGLKFAFRHMFPGRFIF